MDSAITNPSGAMYNVTDFRTGQDASGFDLQQGQVAWSYRANATITKGQALMFVAPTATVPLSVTPATAAITGTDPWLFAGAALGNAEAGQPVLVCHEGVAVVKTDASDTAAFASVLLAPATTTGAFDVKTDPAAGDVVVGVVLGPEIGSSDTALVRLGSVAVKTVVDTS